MHIPRRYLAILLVCAWMLAVLSGAIYAYYTCVTQLTTGTTSQAGNEVQTLDARAAAIVAQMSLEEKVGQLVMIGVHGTELTDDSRFMLSQYHIGGVILFDRNLVSAAQTQALTAQLQGYAQGEAGQKVPLLIGIDEEGGAVVRGRNFIAPPPAEQELGQTGDPLAAARSAAQVGRTLKSLGFNVNFAPVADVGSPRGRAFATDAAQVTAFVEQAAAGYEQEGLLYALKHFPGIGKGRVDSHLEVSTVDAPLATLQNEDLMPFQRVITTRPPENYFVLVSHLIYPALDATHSASQSHAIITGLLRGQMGYQGVIITDDMEMGAVANHASYRELGVNAIQAGADIVMICHEYAHEQEVYLGLLAAAQQAMLSEAQIDAAVQRVVKAKLAHAF